MRSSRNILLIVSLALGTSITWGQSASDHFVLESIRSGSASGEFCLPNTQNAAGQLTQFDPTKYNLDMSGIVEGLSLKRSFTQESVSAAGGPLIGSLHQRDRTEGGLTVFGRTKLGFSMQNDSMSDLRQDTLSSTATRALSIEQGFGSGTRIGALGFSRTVVSHEGIQDHPDTLTTQVINLSAALRPGLTNATAFTTKDSANGTGPSGQDYLTTWALPLSGGKGAFAFGQSDYTQGGVHTAGEKMDFLAPFALMGQKLTLERHFNDSDAGGVRTLADSDKFVMPLKLAGGAGLISLVSTDTINAGVDQSSRKSEVLLPLSVSKRTYTFERSDTDTSANGVGVDDLKTRFAGPVAFLNKAATFDYTVAEHTQTDADSETRTAHFATPFNLLGRTLTTDFTDTSLDAGLTHQTQQATHILAPLAGQKLDITRSVVSNDNGQTDTEQTITQVITPKFSMLDKRADVGVRILRTENEGGYTQEVRAIDVHTQPIKPLTVQGTIQQSDLGPNGGGEGETRDFKTIYSPTDRLALNARYLENQAANQAPTVQRSMDIATKPKSGYGLAMRAGVISWSQEGQAPNSARRVDAQLGNPKKLSLQALYTEYDEKTLAALPAPTVGVAMNAGDPAHLAMQLKYSDQAARPAQERGVALQFHAVGGAMKVGYTENPLDPTTKAVRLATVYDANLERKLFGGVSMNVGYRYLNFDDPTALDNHFATIQLAGGNEAGGGQIKLGYSSGDFVPVVQGKVTPGATLDLTYSRKWGADGKIGVTWRRTTMPIGQVADPSGNEGRVEYEKHF